jgi:metallo-beta-lactamase class B
MAAGGATATALAQNAAPAADTPDAHLALAKEAAGTEFLGTLGRLCILPATGPGADVAPRPAPPRDTWYAEPAKVFDNLYFVGGKIHSAWALTTSEGIILIDTIYPYNSEELIVGGMRKLGLDPGQVKYTIISHGHGDHVGGAKMMQDRFGSRIVMGLPDWEFVENSVNRYGQGPTSVKPRRDIVAEDGQKLTLGDTTVTLVFTPGHTQGTFSMFFEVKDNGRPLTAAYSGGTAFNFVNRALTKSGQQGVDEIGSS